MPNQKEGNEELPRERIFEIHNAASMDPVARYIFERRQPAIQVVFNDKNGGKKKIFNIAMKVLEKDVRSGRTIGALPITLKSGIQLLESTNVQAIIC